MLGGKAGESRHLAEWRDAQERSKAKVVNGRSAIRFSFSIVAADFSKLDAGQVKDSRSVRRRLAEGG